MPLTAMHSSIVCIVYIIQYNLHVCVLIVQLPIFFFLAVILCPLFFFYFSVKEALRYYRAAKINDSHGSMSELLQLAMNQAENIIQDDLNGV